MNRLSDVTNEELREILDLIKRKTNRDIDGETVRKWSRENIDRLLELTRREAAEETENAEPQETQPAEESIYTAEESFEGIPEVEEEQEEVSIYIKPDSFIENPAEETDEDESEEENDDSDMKTVLDISEKAEDEVSDEASGERIKKLMDGGEAERKNVDVSSILGETKGKFSSVAQKLKKTAKKISSMFAADDEEEAREIDDDIFDGDDFEVSGESEASEEDIELPEEDGDEDMKIADFSNKEKDVDTEPEGKAEEKTIYIEKPGLVIKKGESGGDEGLEGVPKIMSADDALANDPKTKIPTIEKMQNDLQKQIQKAKEDGQIVLDGFAEEPSEDTPEDIEEDEAERELFEKRKKKIAEFVLFGDDDDDPYGTDSEKEKIGELFDTNDSRPRRKEPEKFEGLEYAQTKDARRVSRYLMLQKKKFFRKLTGQGVLFVLSVITGIASAAKTTVAGDRFMTIFISLVLVSASVILSGQNIISSFSLLKKKKYNINTVISFAAIICLVQTLLMFVLYFFKNNPVSVFGCAGVGLMLLSELNSYVMNCRTADALELCTGDNKDKLYSIEGISDDKDILELGKNIRSRSPRIRYSCKTRFPAHLIEMCMSETSADKRSKLMLFIVAFLSLINFAAAWIVNGKFAVGFAAFSVTFATCVPAYGALLTQLPLRWVNRKINCEGAMISCQDGVNELYRTNAVIIDSKDLFDTDKFVMVGQKDFNNVRCDEILVYSAAMALRSGGPLTGVFDQVISGNRDLLPTVKSFRYEEKLGVSGWINNQKVVFGNKELMINHNISIPKEVDVDMYIAHGHQVVFLGIADMLAEMYVIDYMPNRTIAPYLKKLRDSGVSILVRNCDPNVDEAMISDCFRMKLDNIKVISSSSGRIFKKYKSRPKVATNASSVHDGTPTAFFRTLCTAAMLSHTFKVTDILSFIGIGMGFAIVLVLSILNVIADMPAIFVLLLQAVITGAFIGITRITCGK